jgi:hypothetical protein
LNAPQIVIIATQIISIGEEIAINYNNKGKGGCSFFDASNKKMKKV